MQCKRYILLLLNFLVSSFVGTGGLGWGGGGGGVCCWQEVGDELQLHGGDGCFNIRQFKRRLGKNVYKD